MVKLDLAVRLAETAKESLLETSSELSPKVQKRS